MDNLLTIKNLTAAFGGLVAVSNVTMKVKPGRIHALIGPNGSGKTTILNLINGICRPSHGEIFLDNQKISGHPPHAVSRRGIARTFQDLQLFSELSVLENVLVARHMCSSVNVFSSLFKTSAARKEECRNREKAIKALALVGIEDKADMDPEHLHYGEKRLVEIARALASEPRLILMDEPSAGMNDPEIQHLKRVIYRMHDKGITVVLIEHNMPVVMAISDLVTVIDFGEKIAEGHPVDIQNNPRVIEAYLGMDHPHA